jgi:hypothetical protein
MRQRDLVDHRGCRGNQVEIIFAGQPLLDDLEVEQPQEAAAETEPQGRRRLHLEAERSIVQAQLVERIAQLLEIGGIDREEAAEHHRLDQLEARQRLGRRALGVGDRVADRGLRDFLDLRGDETDFAGGKLGQLLDLGPHAADPVDEMLSAGRHELDRLALAKHALHDADEDDDAQIGIVPAIDEHRLQGRVAVPLGRRDAGDDRLQHLDDADARFGGGQHGILGGEADNVLDLLLHLVRLGGRQIDLVDDRHDLMIMLDRLIDIGQRLRLDSLRRIHHQQRALAGGKAAAHLIGEVDMAGRVHEVELIGFAVARGVGEAHGLRLDGDAALPLDIHIIEHLRGHFAFAEPAGLLDQPVGKRRLAMIDMGYDAEITNFVERGGHGWLQSSGGFAPPIAGSATKAKDASKGSLRRLPPYGCVRATVCPQIRNCVEPLQPSPRSFVLPVVHQDLEGIVHVA